MKEYNMKKIEGGICAAKGFLANGLHAGIKATSNPSRKDLGLIYSEVLCSAAGLFTSNLVKADPVVLDQKHLENGVAQAVIVNSYIANACAPEGIETATQECQMVSKALNLREEDVLVSSTGVIGVRLNVEAIEAALPELVHGLNPNGSDDVAHAIMTTDTVKKELAYEFELGGKTCHLGGISKGSGMIHPHMGTMLCYLTTDVAIHKDLLKEALKEAVSKSFNRISVDGDMSTNDSCILLANGMAENQAITEKNADYQTFTEVLNTLCVELAREMAADGEGATHLITCEVSGAKDEATAEQLGKSVISSSLTKAAVFGKDANWGRILCAMGYSGAEFKPSGAKISFASAAGTVPVCEGGKGIPFDEELATKVLSEKEVIIQISLAEGNGIATCWGCDLTYDYVKINGDYRT